MSKDGLVVCIFGDREINQADVQLVNDAVRESGFKIRRVLSGKASGGDYLGEVYAKANKIPIKEYPPDWNNLDAEGAVIKTNKFGKQYNAKAGLIRDEKMANDADAGIWLCPNGTTNGSQYTANCFKKLGKPVFIWPTPNTRSEEDEYAYVF